MVTLIASFTLVGITDASVILTTHQAQPNTITTVIHEVTDQAIVHDLIGAETSSPLEVSDGETLTVLVRENGAILASGIFQVTRDHDAPCTLLAPVLCHGIMLSQCEQALCDHAIESAIHHVFDDAAEEIAVVSAQRLVVK
jgi:hypothetical protein